MFRRSGAKMSSSRDFSILRIGAWSRSVSTVSNSDTASMPAHAAQSTALTRTRPFYWSVRRELWEYRSVYFAPLIVAGVVLVMVFLSIGFYPKSYTKSGKGLLFLACPNMLILNGVYTYQCFPQEVGS